MSTTAAEAVPVTAIEEGKLCMSGKKLSQVLDSKLQKGG